MAASLGTGLDKGFDALEGQAMVTLDDKEDDDWLIAAVKKAVKAQTKKGIDERNYSDLTKSEITSAHMTKVSYINLREGQHAAQKYARLHLPNWKLDTALTDEHTAVFVDSNGKVRVAFRGTQHGLTGQDWRTNAALARGVDSNQLQAIDKTLKDVMTKYGKDNVTHLGGHSKGGGTAILFGEKYDINTHTFDPFVPPRQMLGGKTKAFHSIVKTPTDLVSAGSNVAAFREGVTVKDVRSKTGSGLLASHSLDNMTGVRYLSTAKGNTKYAPHTKNKAFLINELAKGKSKEQIAKDLDYSSQRERNQLEFDLHHLDSNPELHGEHLAEAGVSNATPTFKDELKKTFKTSVDRASGKVLQGVAAAGSAGGLAGIASSIGVSGALNAMGSENEAVNEAAVGGISNISQDVVQASYNRIRSGGHARNVRGALSNISADLRQSIASQTGVAEVTAQHASNAARMRAIGQTAIKSLGKGAISGLVGYGVKSALNPGFQALGLNHHDADVVSRMLAAAASGVVFGPEAVPIFMAIEGLMIAGEEIWHAFVPPPPPPPPTIDEAAGMYGADHYQRQKAKERLQYILEQKEKEREEGFQAEQLSQLNKINPKFYAQSLGGQVAAGRLTKDGRDTRAPLGERRPVAPTPRPTVPTPRPVVPTAPAPSIPRKSELQQGRTGDFAPKPNRGLRG